MGKLDPEATAEPVSDEHAQQLLKDYVDAFEAYDVHRIVELLTADATWEMPPFEGWYQGAEAIGELVRTHCPAEKAGDQVMVQVSANGQPALALYMIQPDGSHRAFQLQVPTVTAEGISHVACFFDTKLFARFGLPDTLAV